jgi:hypothetical protein
MKLRNVLKHQAQARSADVCVEHRVALSATDGGTRSVATLSNSVANVDRLNGVLERCRDRMTAALAAMATARPFVRWALTALVNIAPSVSLEPADAKVFHMPLSRKDEELLAVAREAMDRITPYAKEFLAAGLPPKVLSDLPAQIADFAAARLDWSDARREYTITTDNIDKELAAGDAAIRVAQTILNDSPTAPTDAVKKLRMAKRIGPSKTKAATPHTPAATTPAQPSTPTPTQAAAKTA